MRIIIMLSPTNRHGTKTAYTKLREFLKSDGYLSIGPDVYMRITPNRKAVVKHLNRLEEYNPGTGIIRVLKLTENQYEKIWYLTGGPDIQEETVGNKPVVII